eukprot:gene3245-biopygen4903
MSAQSKKKGPKDTLKTFETTYKAACRHHGVPLAYKPLLLQLQECQEASKPCTKVLLAGASVDRHVLSAVVDALAYYQPAKVLQCFGCNIGNEGIMAISALLKASAGRWWKGCKLNTLEIHSDGSSQQLEQQPHHQHCHHHKQQTSLNPRAEEISANLDRRPLGVCPPMPAYLEVTSPTLMQRAQNDMNSRLASYDHIHYRQHPPQPLMHAKMLATDATMMPWRQALPQPIGVTTADSKTQPEYQSSAHQQMSAAPAALHDNGACRFSTAALQELSLALGVLNLGLVRLVLDHTMLGNDGMAALSLGLAGCCSLKHFSACHCGIGPSGIRHFVTALIGCSSSSNNSSSGSFSVARAGDLRGIRHSASMAAASRLSHTSSSNPPSQSSTPRVATVGLALDELHLSGNPLKGRGLQHLNPVLHAMASLKVLGLASIDVTDADKVQLAGLVSALTLGQSQITAVDFGGNHIGNRCAKHLLTVLEQKTSLQLLKLTPHLECDVVERCTLLMQQNLQRSKAAKVHVARTAAAAAGL